MPYLLIILRLDSTGHPGDGDAAPEVVFGSAQIDAFDGEISAALCRTRAWPEGSDARVGTHGTRLQATGRTALSAQGTPMRRTIQTVTPRAHQVTVGGGGEMEDRECDS